MYESGCFGKALRNMCSGVIYLVEEKYLHHLLPQKCLPSLGQEADSGPRCRCDNQMCEKGACSACAIEPLKRLWLGVAGHFVKTQWWGPCHKHLWDRDWWIQAALTRDTLRYGSSNPGALFKGPVLHFLDFQLGSVQESWRLFHRLGMVRAFGPEGTIRDAIKGQMGHSQSLGSRLS